MNTIYFYIAISTPFLFISSILIRVKRFLVLHNVEYFSLEEKKNRIGIII